MDDSNNRTEILTRYFKIYMKNNAFFWAEYLPSERFLVCCLNINGIKNIYNEFLKFSERVL
jgi:hypothetical protein